MNILPNIKSAKKRVKVIETKTLRNQMIKSALKTYIKKFEALAESGNKAEATTAFNVVVCNSLCRLLPCYVYVV